VSTLEGAGQLEDLPMREVLDFLDGIVQLVAKGSADILHRRLHEGGGRYPAAIESASHIRIARLSSGSVVADLLPAKVAEPDGTFPLGAATLSQEAFSLVIDVASGRRDEHPDVSAALEDFIGRVVARRPGARVVLEEHHTLEPRSAVLEVPSGVAEDSVPMGGMADLNGRLFEANLETRSASIRTQGWRESARGVRPRSGTRSSTRIRRPHIASGRRHLRSEDAPCEDDARTRDHHR